ncbi:hypothetical protein AADX92_12130, partial [Staphylococcus epidermidis]|uniref:hypothetical protein n=1 Tax=Staphylococcus epidermidis TaxID=1282 RepID=UPI00311F9166
AGVNGFKAVAVISFQSVSFAFPKRIMAREPWALKAVGVSLMVLKINSDNSASLIETFLPSA